MKSFFIKYLLSMIGFKRYKNIIISKDILDESSNLIGNIPWDKDFISPVWEEVFSKFGISKFDGPLTDANIDILKSSYENFFVNGLSDGACVGEDLKRLRTMFKYVIRGSKRLKLLNRHFKFQDPYSDPFHDLKLSPELSSGKPWVQSINGESVNPELIDHLYFFKFCQNLPISKNRLLFLGDGSGILSNIFLNNSAVEDATFIDLPHFLIRQHIVNFSLLNVNKKYLTPNQVGDIVSDEKSYVLVTQDNLPEIPQKYLEIYFDLISKGLITDVLSYNKRDLSFGHTDFRSILLSKGISCLLSIESVMRPGYFLEWYSINKK